VTTTGAAAIAVLACAGSLHAHHASVTIDLSAPIWIKGTVVRYEPINPHTLLVVDVAVGAEVQRWRVEGPFLARLKRMGVDVSPVQPGDVIEVCGFPSKGSAPAERSSTGAPPLIHGHVLVMPDGRLRSWGPYGKLDNCVRPDDGPERWVDFVSSDPQAREAWCDEARAAIPTRAESTALVDEIDRALANPCGAETPSRR
jgi:hypothetical protein